MGSAHFGPQPPDQLDVECGRHCVELFQNLLLFLVFHHLADRLGLVAKCAMGRRVGREWCGFCHLGGLFGALYASLGLDSLENWHIAFVGKTIACPFGRGRHVWPRLAVVEDADALVCRMFFQTCLRFGRRFTAEVIALLDLGFVLGLQAEDFKIGQQAD